MEFKKNNSQGLLGQETSFKDGIRSFFKKALDNQIFFNSRLKALEYIEKQGKVTTAMLTVNIAKVKGIFGIDYEIKFSLLYSTGDGQVFQTKNFYNVEMPGKEGMIPNYILKTLEEEEALEIKFNLDDLSALYDERNIKIDEESTFDEIIKLCKKENVAVIQMIDRVFYTRIECYNSDKKKVGAIHIGVLHCLPKDLAKILYPGGIVEYTL